MNDPGGRACPALVPLQAGSRASRFAITVPATANGRDIPVMGTGIHVETCAVSSATP